MKTKLFILSVVLAMMLAGCVTVPKCPPCPPENTLFMTPSGPAEMRKGFFDQGEGEDWMHTEDYKNAIEKRDGV